MNGAAGKNSIDTMSIMIAKSFGDFLSVGYETRMRSNTSQMPK
jgi:hypothetical protein